MEPEWEEFKLVRIKIPPHQYRDVLKRLWTEHNSRLADINFVGNIPVHMLAEIKALDDRSRIILLNQRVSHESYTTLMGPRMFPFCSVYRSGNAVTVLQTNEALQRRNYFLCVKRRPIKRRTRREDEERSPIQCPLAGLEYPFHTTIEETKRWRTRRPAYVNLDRTSDNIGMSSWSGNLTSWSEAGFQTRVLYGFRAGYYAE